MSQTNNTYSIISEIQQSSQNVILTDGITEWVTVYFKEAYTENIKYYNIPIKWTIEEFVNIVGEWIIEDFDLASRNYDDDYTHFINIIEMGQEIPGVKPEDASPVEEEDITYYDKYIVNKKWPGFYIKITTNKKN
jgi:hypothetical protein